MSLKISLQFLQWQYTILMMNHSYCHRIKPDWVLRKDNTQEIVDPLQAIVMVMDTLGFACYWNVN